MCNVQYRMNLNGDDAMAKEKLIIRPKNPKGEDGYRTFSIRIKEETVNRLEEICNQCGYSRNELIAKFLEYGLENCEIKGEES